MNCRGRALVAGVVAGVAAAGCGRAGGGAEGGSSQIIPPAGFRAVALAEYPELWSSIAEPYRPADRASGDFDGDGEADEARLWIAADAGEWVVAVYLSGVPDGPIRLVGGRGGGWRARALGTIAPGEHRTHRYYGLGPGEADTTAVVTLVREAIHFGRLEAEGVVYAWDPEARRFVAIAMY